MNRSNKLFLAAVLLAVGYGVASLLGSPGVPYLPPAATIQSPATAGAIGSIGVPPIGQVVGGVRLLPDLSSTQTRPADQISPATISRQTPPSASPSASPLPGVAAIPLAPPALSSPANAGAPDASSGQLISTGIVSLPPALSAAPPNYARLNDTPPRPLDIQEPAQPLTGRPAFGAGPASAPLAPAITKSGAEQITFLAPPLVSSIGAQLGSPPAVATVRRADGSAGFDVPSSQPPMRQAMLTAPALAPAAAAPSPPMQLRTHVITDGDSLSKLAKRYLGDPQKADEIFAANRELLNSPDLLPIGVELKIPARAKASGG